MSRAVGDSYTVTPARAGTEIGTDNQRSGKIPDIEMHNNQHQRLDGIKNKTNDNISGPMHVERGYNWFIASIIVVADMVGGGIVAMPAGFHETGMLLGCIFMGLIAIFFTNTAYLLAETWAIMRDRWVVYQSHCRQPYPEIGLRSFGPRMRTFTALCVNSTLFGVTTVYVILSASIFHKVLIYSGFKMDFCLLLIILCLIILPVTFLKSPADFWLVLAMSLFCTIAAVALILLGVGYDYSSCESSAVYRSPSFHALYSLGTFVFAYSGHHVFPTIQHDMREPKDFTKSIILGFIITGLLYIPLSVFSYTVYGQSMENSVIDSLQTTWIRHAADLAVAFHCVLTIILTINPINQQLEDLLNVPHKMCWQRIAVRTSLLMFILFIALSVPNFGSIMDFFGSTTIPFTCIMLPTLFGLSLKSQRYNEKTKKWKIPTLQEIYERTPRYKLYWYLLINAVTIIASAISAVMAVKAMATIRFVPPCYIQPFLEKTDHINVTDSLLNCCGQYSNITWNPEIQCSAGTH
uniref:Amino acid transporter transmembrane domain-containing protein n=1 Tax=Setaria digitata TaxID=48799 RepID=A0A915PJS1_9BILA